MDLGNTANKDEEKRIKVLFYGFLFYLFIFNVENQRQLGGDDVFVGNQEEESYRKT